MKTTKTCNNIEKFFVDDTDGEWVFIDEIITVPDKAVVAWFELILF